MKALTFQSKEVWDILQKDLIYHASPELQREHTDYVRDREQLGGAQPIWLFAPTWLCWMAICRRSFWIRCKEEMGVNSLKDLYVFEVDIDSKDMKVGLTHNSCNWAMVTPELKIQQIRAVHKVITDSEVEYRFLIKPIKLLSSDAIIKEKLDTRIWDRIYHDCFHWCRMNSPHMREDGTILTNYEIFIENYQRYPLDLDLLIEIRNNLWDYGKPYNDFEVLEAYNKTKGSKEVR